MNRSLPLVFALLLAPALASAVEIDVRSKHEATLMVDGDTRNYFRVVAGKSLGFVVKGPEELSIAVRQDLQGDEKAGEVETEFMVFQDGFRIRRITLKEPDGGMYLTDMEYVPSEKKILKIKVPEGMHAYRFELVTRGRSIAVSVIAASEDLEAMMAVGLVEEEPAKQPAPKEPAIELVAFEDSRTDPVPPPPAAPPVVAPPPVVAAVEVKPAEPESGGEVALASLPPLPDHLKRPEPPAAPAGPRRRYLKLGLRVLAAASGVGSPAIGGGAHALYRTGLLKDGLDLGLAVDYLPASSAGTDAAGEPRRLDWQGLSFGLALRLQTPSLRGLRWQAQLIGGAAFLSASTAGRSASGITPALGVSLGPSFALGPGAVTLEAQTTILFGGPEDDTGALSASSLLGGLGLTVGYQLAL
ncbi:MAG: hypothetical protein P1V51_01365 [Deltaproteobacteria bacterium]|nr:hypothetical protein [Deltaproteobacteria bacterium]